MATGADAGGDRNLKVNAYVLYLSPVSRLYVATGDDDDGRRNRTINLLVRYRSPVLHQQLAATAGVRY